jgi:hypothetical protein
MYKVFHHGFIKNSVYPFRYRDLQLDTVATGMLGYGKYVSESTGIKISGDNVLQFSTGEQKKYVLRDAELVIRLIERNNYEVFNILRCIADIAGLDFKQVCHAGVGKAWEAIIYGMIQAGQCSRPSTTDRLKKRTYAGGIVLEPEPKSYTTPIEVFDVKGSYPVLLDSDHGTWNAYGNQYWPRYFLIDTQGYIRYDHIGEGGYDQTEKAIQSLVTERAALMGAKEISFNAKPTVIKQGSLQYVDLSQSTTPEIYIGYDTARAPLGNPEGFKPNHTVSYSIQSNTNFKPDVVYLQGNWKNNPDNMELQNDTGRILLTYYAKAVNIIAGGKGGGVVSNDVGAGAVAASTAKTPNKSLGVDLSQDGSFRIDSQRLYNLSIHNNYAVHNIVIDIKGKGFQFYTFTFG